MSEAQEIKSQSENREEIIEIAPQKIFTEPRPTTTSVPRTTRLPVTTSVKPSTEKRIPPVTTTEKSTTEKKITSTQPIQAEEKTTEAPKIALEPSKRPNFGGRRTRTRTTPSSANTSEETTSQSTKTTEEAKIIKKIEQKAKKLILDTEEKVLDKPQEEIPVVDAKLKDEAEIIVKIENVPVTTTIKEEKIQVTEAPIVEEDKTTEVITTEEPKLSTKKLFTKRKMIFGKLKPRPVAATEEPEIFSAAPKPLSPVSELKKNFRKIKPRPIITTEQPAVVLSTTEEVPAVPLVRKSFRKLVTRTTTTGVPETVRSSDDLSEPSKSKQIFSKLKFRTATTEKPEDTSSTTELLKETSEISTESSIPQTSDEILELQKIDEHVTVKETTEEPEPEERRAIPIKRKQVKLYRKGRRNVFRK